MWVCLGTLPHSTTPVAFVSTEDQSGGNIECKLIDPQNLGRGLRWGQKLAELLDALLAA